MNKSVLGKDFLWGASVSAYQVEGGNHNQWTLWELEHADKLAKAAPRLYGQLPNWSSIEEAATDPANYINGAGVDHFNRYDEDFALAEKLNLTAFRFGIEWSRIEPEPGRFNQAAIDHYKQYIKSLQSHSLQPVITLWHWTHPVWFEKKGGFAKRRNIRYFTRFVNKIAEDLVLPAGIVLVLNEPNSYVGMSYLSGQWPPGRRRLLQAAWVYNNLAVAHIKTYKLLKKLDPSLVVGLAHQCNNSQPKRPGSWLDRLVAKVANYGWNWWFLNRVGDCQDFIGFNYYFTDYFKGIVRKNPSRYNKTQRGLQSQRRRNPPGPISDLGWYMEPAGIYKIIKQAVRRYHKPIIITETGVADANDQYRKWWLEETLSAVDRANSEGAGVVGYFCWSLLDNFEWTQGWWPKFGLIEVDRADGMKRRRRPSAEWLAKQLAKK